MLERHQLYLYNCRFSHRSLPFRLQYWLHGFPGLFTDTSEHIRACLWKSFTKIVLSYTCISVGKWCGILSETRNNKSSEEQSVTRLVKNFDKLCHFLILSSIAVLSSPIIHHSFIPGLNLPFLQIFFTAAFLFFFRADSADSPDCCR